MKSVALPTLLLPLLAAGLLSACAGTPLIPPAQSFEGRSEKSALAVLRNVEADDAQRAKILAAYDQYNPAMLQLGRDWAELTREWTQLDRTRPDFWGAAESLAQRRMKVARQQFDAAAACEHEGASVLSAEQWAEWQELWALTGEGTLVCGPGGYRPRRR